MRSTAVTIKVKFCSQQRCLSVSDDEAKGMAALESFIKRSFNIQDHQAITLKYTDSDGDLITFDSDEELALALKTAPQPLRVLVLFNKNQGTGGSSASDDKADNNIAQEQQMDPQAQKESEQQQEPTAEEVEEESLEVRARGMLYRTVKQDPSFSGLLPRACATLSTGFDIQFEPKHLVTFLELTGIPLRRLVMCGLVPAGALETAKNDAMEAVMLAESFATDGKKTSSSAGSDIGDDTTVALDEEEDFDQAYYHVDGKKIAAEEGEDAGNKSDSENEAEREEGEETAGGEGEGESRGGADGAGGAVVTFLREKGLPVKSRADVLALIRAFKLPPRAFLRYPGITVKDICGYRHFFVTQCLMVGGGGPFALGKMMHHRFRGCPMKRVGGMCGRRGGGRRGGHRHGGSGGGAMDNMADDMSPPHLHPHRGHHPHFPPRDFGGFGYGFGRGGFGGFGMHGGPGFHHHHHGPSPPHFEGEGPFAGGPGAFCGPFFGGGPHYGHGGPPEEEGNGQRHHGMGHLGKGADWRGGPSPHCHEFWEVQHEGEEGEGETDGDVNGNGCGKEGKKRGGDMRGHRGYGRHHGHGYGHGHGHHFHQLGEVRDVTETGRYHR